MSFVITTSISNASQLNPFEELNTTEEKINYLEIRNYKSFVELLPTVFLITLLIAVGVFGNLLVFLVYLKKFKSSATRVFVLAMTVCDLYTTVLGLPLVIYGVRYIYTSDVHYCKTEILLGPYFPVIMSYWILVFVALDRRRRICKALKRQLSARQATCLLMIPLSLTSAPVFFVAFLHREIPLETDRPGITGTTCGFLDRLLGIKAKQIYGIVIMAYFIIGFAVLTTCYVQISYQIYHQKKRLFAGKVNVATRSGIMETRLEKRTVLGEKKLQIDTNTYEDTIISNMKVEVVVKKLTHLEEDVRSKTETLLSRDTQEKSRLVIKELRKLSIFCEDKSEVNADRHDLKTCSGHNQVSQCSSVTGADCVMSRELKQELMDMSEDPGIEDLSEHVMRSLTETTLNSAHTDMFSTCSTNNESRDHKNNKISSCSHRLQTGEEGQRKKARLSRTTFMMLILTTSMVVCCLPNIAVALVNVQYVNVHLSPWKMNIYFLVRIFPTINCALNPFIYSFCNLKFRLQCRQFLTDMRNAFFRLFDRTNFRNQ